MRRAVLVKASRARPRFVLPLVVLAGAVTACEDPEPSYGVFVTQTAVVVDPEQIIGDLSCTESLGGVQSLSVTLTDITDAARPLVLPTAGPLSCHESAEFRFVTVGHSYVAEIDGYLEPPEALTPLGAGSRSLLDVGGKRIAPDWQATCGVSPLEPAVAVSRVQARFDACVPFVDAAPTAGTVTIKVGDLSPDCLVGEQAIAQWRVTQGAAETLAACGEAALTMPSASGQAGLTIDALDEDGLVLAATHCQAPDEHGVSTIATCQPLSSLGGVTVHLTCTGEGTVEVTLQSGLMVTTSRGECGSALSFPSVAPGWISINVNNEAVCNGEVLPGRMTEVTCG